MGEQQLIRDAVIGFLTSCPTRYDFPLGGCNKLLQVSEHELATAIREAAPIAPHVVSSLRSRLSSADAYSLVIFAVRMAVFAARSNSSSSLIVGLLGLVIDDELVDWRDILACLAIIEACAHRAGVDFEPEIRKVALLAAEKRKETIVEGYLNRPIEMRRTEIMGFKAVNTAEGLGFERV